MHQQHYASSTSWLSINRSIFPSSPFHVAMCVFNDVCDGDIVWCNIICVVVLISSMLMINYFYNNGPAKNERLENKEKDSLKSLSKDLLVP